MKTAKRLSALILAVIMLLTMALPTLAVSEKDWEKVWSSTDAQAGIIMFVGSNESERNFSWYSDSEGDPTVTISKSKSLKNPHVFVGTCVAAVDGGVVNKVNVTDLEEGTTYYQYTTMGVECLEETVMPMALMRVSNLIEKEGYIALPQRRQNTKLQNPLSQLDIHRYHLVF